MSDEINYEDEKKRALIFQERKTIVHIATNLFFTNGLILEVGNDFVIIKDRQNGDEQVIFFSQLKKSIEAFREIAR